MCNCIGYIYQTDICTRIDTKIESVIVVLFDQGVFDPVLKPIHDVIWKLKMYPVYKEIF